MDNNPSTEVVYKNPNTISEGTYIGVKYNKVINIKDIEFSLGAISNQNDTMQEAKDVYKRQLLYITKKITIIM